ncbi:MAG TPA: TonB-dependent receptor [Polyangiaceae bacterium]|nr:TonB-dependent receptor [Polyangiaceae bacterium]
MPGLHVLVVTLDRREQSLQSYPHSASAFDQNDLDRLGLASVRDLGSAIPALEVGNQEGNSEIYIRGVGSNNNTELGDPATATHIDGIYIPRPRGVGSLFFDLERIESHRGPQGTLRGRNSTAGSLNIVTNKPKLETWEADTSIQFGNYSQRLMRGMLNVPVGKTVALRAAAFSERRDPFYENVTPGSTLRAAEDADSFAYRLGMKWQPTEKIALLVSHDLTREQGVGWAGADFAPALDPERVRGRKDVDPIPAEQIRSPRSVLYRGPQGSMKLTHWGLGANLTADLGAASVEYLSSFRRISYKQASPGSVGIGAVRDVTSDELDNWSTSFFDNTSETIVQELRLFSHDTERLRWTAGIFYFNEQQRAFFATVTDRPAEASFQSEVTVGSEFNMPLMIGDSYATYADATLDLFRDLRVTAGVRLTNEQKRRDGIAYIYTLNRTELRKPGEIRLGTPGFRYEAGSRTDFDPNRAAEDLQSGVAQWGVGDTLQGILEREALDPDSLVKQRENQYNARFFDYRVGLDYDIRRGSLLYINFSTAHKSGGFNDTLKAGTEVNIPPTYKPEVVYATELGVKNQLLRGRLIVNLATFWYAYTDLQYQVLKNIKNQSYSAARFNAANSRIWGLEGEVVGFLPLNMQLTTSGLLLDARVSSDNSAHIDPRITEQCETPRDCGQLTGKFLPRAPALSVNYALSGSINAKFGIFDWTIAAQSRTKQYMSLLNGEGRDARGNLDYALSDVVPGYTRVNINARWTHPLGYLSLEAFVNNLTDVTYMTSQIQSTKLDLRFFNPPRQFGVRCSLFL